MENKMDKKVLELTSKYINQGMGFLEARQKAEKKMTYRRSVEEFQPRFNKPNKNMYIGN